jgi:hypothetical protein
VLTIIRNEEVIKLTAGGSFGSMLGNLDCGLKTPFIPVTRTSGGIGLRSPITAQIDCPRCGIYPLRN